MKYYRFRITDHECHHRWWVEVIVARSPSDALYIARGRFPFPRYAFSFEGEVR